MKPIASIIIPVLALAPAMVMAETGTLSISEVSRAAMPNFDCESFYAGEPSEIGSLRSWVACTSRDGEHYLLSGLAEDGGVAARLEYQARDGRVNLSVEYSGEYGELNAEYVSGTVVLDAVYSGGVSENEAAAGAQLALSALECFDPAKQNKAESEFWSTSSSSNQGAPVASITAFYNDPAAEATADLVQGLFSALSEDGLLEQVHIPIHWRGFSEYGFIESSLLSFDIL